MVHAHTHKSFAWSIAALLCLLSLQFLHTSAQSVLIDPLGEGGFENGSDFTSNGWTLINNASNINSNWYIDTAISNGEWIMPSASRCAFVSDSLGASWTYNTGVTTLPSTVHFYRDVTFPAGETNMQLSFDILCNGEGYNYDVFYVWLCPVTLTPTNGSPVSMSDITVWSGTGTATPIYKKQGTSNLSIQPVSTVNITIPPALINNCNDSVAMRLVFGWKNDESLQFDPPVAIDNISLVSGSESFSPGVMYYSIDNTLPDTGANFASFSSAISFINAASFCNSLPDSLIFEVVAGQEFSENLPVITASGTAESPIIFRRSGSGVNPVIYSTGSGSNDDAGIAISGGDYFTFDGIDVQLVSSNELEYGYLIRNGSSVDGAQFNTIKNCNITLNKAMIRSRGILQSASHTSGKGFDPGSESGSNDNNVFENIHIQNCYSGILITNQSELFPDNNTTVTNCIIGTPYTGIPAGNIGGGGLSVYGIQLSNQKNCVVTGNNISNLTSNGTGVRGIYILNGQGTLTISGNRVLGIRNIDVSSTSAAIGIDVSLSSLEGEHIGNIYNNFVSDITSGYAGGATLTRILKGMIIRGGNVTSAFNLDHNSISIDGSGCPKASSVVLEYNTLITTNNVRNNIFANSTNLQTGNLGHYIFATTATNQIGAVGSQVNNNNYYLPFSQKGFIGYAGGTNHASIPNWKAAISVNTGIDSTAITSDPQFLDPALDLHATSPALNGAAIITGITSITTDFDGDIRALTPDIGADEFSTSAIDLGIEDILSPAVSGCFNSTDSITLAIRNLSPYTLNYLGNPATITVQVTGPVSYSSEVALNSGTFGGLELLELRMPIGFDLSQPGMYTITASIITTGDVNPDNDIMIVNREVILAAQDLPYIEDFDLLPEMPEGWTTSGFSFGTHAGATESNQVYTNISELNPYSNFTIRKIGPVSESSMLSFNYRVTDVWDPLTAEEDPLWGEILISVSMDCGTSFSLLGEISTAVLPYTNIQFALNAFSGGDIILKFEGTWAGGDSTNCWVDIDNINIYNSSCPDIYPTGDSFGSALDIGDLTFPYITNGDNLVTNCWSNDYGYTSPDVYYRFTPLCTGELTLSLCGSGFNTVLYLLDEEGNVIASNDDFCEFASELTYTIDSVGSAYYIVIEGKTTATGTYSLLASFIPDLLNHYADLDNDTYGDISNVIISCATELAGFVLNDLDCDDADPLVNPSAMEICDGIDNDCNGFADEDTGPATLTPGPSVVTCKGTPVILNANTDEGYTYAWFKNNNLIPGATGSSFTTQKPGDFHVQVNFPSGCFNISPVTSISINPLPAATITAPYGLSLCTYVGLSASGGVGQTYQWYRNGLILEGVTTLQYHAVSAGSYFCVITDVNGCSKNSNTLVVTACREEGTSGLNAYFNLAPNPAYRVININFQLQSNNSGSAEMQVFNAAGQLVKSIKQELNNGYLEVTLSVEDLPKGLYHMVILTENERYTEVFAVER